MTNIGDYGGCTMVV